LVPSSMPNFNPNGARTCRPCGSKTLQNRPLSNLNTGTARNAVGQSNLANRPHRRDTWMVVQSYSPCGDNVHPLTHAYSLGLPEYIPQTASRSVQAFLHSSRQGVPILTPVCPSPSKLPLRMGRSRPPSNTWFLGPTRVHNPNGTSIGFAVLQGLRKQRDRPQYSVCNNRPHLAIYVRSTAMRPNKNNIFVIIFTPL